MLKRLYHTSAKIFSPKYFLTFSHHVKKPLGVVALVLIIVGISCALFLTPADYRQSDLYRIMYIHVPAAWLSLMIYAYMAILSVVYYVWKIRVAAILALHSAPIGALFTSLTLISGAIWGEPAWGSWWHWDVRIISEFILLLIYVAYMVLYYSLPNDPNRFKLCAIFACIGAINLPIIKFSVQWWSSLHQMASINLITGAFHLSSEMILTLVIMWGGYLCYYLWCITALTQKTLLND